MDRTDYPVDYNVFEIGYCCHPNSPYANIELKKATSLIILHFKEEYHPIIHDTLSNKKTQLVALYFVYIPKNNR